MRVLVGSTVLAKYIEIFREPKDVGYFSDEVIDGAECFIIRI